MVVAGPRAFVCATGQRARGLYACLRNSVERRGAPRIRALVAPSHARCARLWAGGVADSTDREAHFSCF